MNGKQKSSKKAFDGEKATANEYKQSLQKLDVEFREKLIKGQKDFEEAIEKEKRDKEAECLENEIMRVELKSREKEVHELREELNRKRKREEKDAPEEKSQCEEKRRFLEKCNDELKCSICDEIFIEPMWLNCGHVYCHFCLENWKKECKKAKKEFSCPNCRSKITQSNRSLHLGNLVNAIFSDVSGTLKQDREETIKERIGAIQNAGIASKRTRTKNMENNPQSTGSISQNNRSRATNPRSSQVAENQTSVSATTIQSTSTAATIRTENGRLLMLPTAQSYLRTTQRVETSRNPRSNVQPTIPQALSTSSYRGI